MSLRDIKCSLCETDSGIYLRVGIRIIVKLCVSQAP